MFETEDSRETVYPPGPSGWLWAARAVAAVSIFTVAGPLLLATRRSAFDPTLALGGALAVGYAVVLLLLSSQKRSAAFAVGLGMASVLGVVVLFVVVMVAFLSRSFSGPGSPSLLSVGLPQLVLIAACSRIARSHPSRGRIQGYALAAGLLTVTLFVAVVAPTLRGHPPRYASDAIGELRSFASAQAAYQSANYLYASPECLSRPSDCIPGHPESAPIFFGPRAAAVRATYLRVFHPGPAETFVDDAGVMHTGFASWALTAAPLGETERGFCVDASGAILYTRDRSVPSVKSGECVRGPSVDLLN